MAFRIPLSPRTTREMVETNALAWAFQDADDAGKARILLDAARTLRDGLGVSSRRGSYNEAYLYRVIPEIARRLDPSIEILPVEVQPDSEEHHADRLVRNLSNEDLGVFACLCGAHADYRGLTDDFLKNVDRDFPLDDPEVRKVTRALNMLTCHDVHGNYAIHAMLALDAEATQAGVKKLPGRFSGVATELNIPRDRDPSAGKPWCLVVARKFGDQLSKESDDAEEIRKLYDLHMRAWADTHAWEDPDREPGEIEKGLVGTQDSGLPSAHYKSPVAIRIEHRDLGVQKTFMISDVCNVGVENLFVITGEKSPEEEDEGPQP